MYVSKNIKVLKMNSFILPSYKFSEMYQFIEVKNYQTWFKKLTNVSSGKKAEKSSQSLRKALTPKQNFLSHLIISLG